MTPCKISKAWNHYAQWKTKATNNAHSAEERHDFWNSHIYTEQEQSLTEGYLEITDPVIQELFTASLKIQLQYCNNGCPVYMFKKSGALQIDWSRIIAA